jgi:hypothetical protein
MSTRYDLDRSQLFDAEFSIGRVIRCIEPRLVYSHRMEQIRLEINLVGLGNVEDLPPAGSVPPPTGDFMQAWGSDCEECTDVAAVRPQRSAHR